MNVSPDLARTTWRAGEPLVAQGFFTPEVQHAYGQLGLDVKNNRAAGYFPGRAAPMGRVSWPVVQATFFNFSPLAVQFGMAGAWDVVSPEHVWDARVAGNHAALTRLLGDVDVSEAADLAERAASAITPYGRPLAATLVAMPVPEGDLMRLWWALTALREYRGDGHIAVLVEEGIDGPQSNVLDVARAELWNKDGLKSTRAWSDDEWAGAVDALATRGWVTADEGFTAAGRAARQGIEDRTNRAAVAAWDVLGEDGCTRFRDLLAPLGQAVVDGGGLPIAKR